MEDMMYMSATFDSTKESLADILRDIKSGRIQLPDFQRDWIWDNDHIKSLLASVSVAFPIGVVMLLGTGNEDICFKVRPVAGVNLEAPKNPEWLILDGQQRLTSLFLALYFDKPVRTHDAKGYPIERWYYIHIPTAIGNETDQEEAIISVPAGKRIKDFRGEVILDCSDIEKECKADLFPLPLIFNFGKLMSWQATYLNCGSEKIQLWTEFGQYVIPRIQNYQVPVIKLFKETPKEAVCQVFEKVNTGGVPLNVFELLTATFAADNYNLRDDWNSRLKELEGYDVLKTVLGDEFLQVISLLSTYKKRAEAIHKGTDPQKAPAVTCKRKDLLKISLDEYKSWSDQVMTGFKEAAKFLHAQRIYDYRDVPYHTQMVPLVAIFTLLGDRADNAMIWCKLSQWYWCGVFGELYGSAVESRFAKDLPQVIGWINGGEEPDTVKEANFEASRLSTLRTRNSAAYKGLYALLMKDGCLDFKSGQEISIQTYFEDNIDIHHIFPQAYCRSRKIDPRKWDSIVNKTSISAKTNRIIGGKAPSEYLGKLKLSYGLDDSLLRKIIESHAIDMDPLLSDDFDEFFKRRATALLGRIEQAMGKGIVARELEGEQLDEDVSDQAKIPFELKDI